MKNLGAPLRLIRIIDRLNVGGPAKHVTWLTAGLDPAEFETVLVTGTVPPGEGDMSWFARQAGVEPHVIPEMSRELSPRDLVVVLKLLRLFLRYKPDLIHTHKAKAGAAGRAAALAYNLLTGGRCKVVHTYHGHIFHSYYGRAKTAVFIAIEKALARLATDRIVTISDQQRYEIRDIFGVGRPAQHRVIPLGLDFTVTGPATLRSELAMDKDTPLIGIVGRLCEVKNHGMFIEAASLLWERRHPCRHGDKDCCFAIIGDGHLREELERQARDMGVEEAVYFTGFRDDVLNQYDDLDVVAITSLNEGTPLTLIEAMSRGVPAVATEVGGVVDLMGEPRGVRDGLTLWEHGITVPSRDVERFARAVGYLIDHPEERMAMGARARDFVRARLSKERLIKDIVGLYRELMG